jgi:acyl-CoA thioester hydrolase
MTPAPEVFELSISVEAADIDQLGHVNNVTYVRWVQEAAVAHWKAAAPIAEQARILFIVLRHEIDYLKPAFSGDRIIARTWIGTATRVRFERYTELLRQSDHSLLAKARTVWCSIDLATGKPVAVSPEARARFSV